MRIKFCLRFLKLKRITDFIVMSLIFSCTNESTKVEAFSKDILNQNNNLEYIVFIPSAGCVGCISYSESLIEKYANDDRFFFIIENLHNTKELSLKIGKNVNTIENVRILNHSMDVFENFISPKVYIVSTQFVQELDEMFIFSN